MITLCKRAGIVLAVAALLPLLGISAQTSEAACAETAGTVEQKSYRSVILGTDMLYALYTPPCYAQQTERTYPVIYLMHGSDATGTDYWIKLGLIEALDQGITQGWLPPMIVALPFGDWIANQNQFGRVSWGNIFLTELLPAVESSYRVDARREMRAIGGISRGGFWAYNIAFLHPELFISLGGHSAFFHPDHLRSNNPLFLAESAPNIGNLRIWLDYGKFDYALPNGDLLHRRLEARGVPHIYTVYPEGRHAPDYWAAHITDYLMFYGLLWLTPPATPAPILTPTQFVPIPPSVTPPPARNTLRQTGGELALFVPAVGYRSLQASMSGERLRAVLAGVLDEKLVIDAQTAQALVALGAALHPQTRIAPPADLLPLLEQDRSLWTIRAWERLTPRFRIVRVDETHPVDYMLDGDAGEYPLAFAAVSGGFDPERLTRFTFSGVTAMVRDTAFAIDEHGTAWAADGLRGFTRRADFFHISNEVSFHPTCPKFEGGAPPGPFCAKDAYLNVLIDLGADIVELSGNHNNDYGHAAYLRTLEMYRAQGIKTVGGGATLSEARQPLTFRQGGSRVALLSCNWAGPTLALAAEDAPGAAFCDEGWLAAEIPRLKAENDVVIVTVQYREFDLFTPTVQQRADFRKLADLGADAVIGTQAHVPQTFEFYPAAHGEAYIHFGLGNVYFDQTYFQMRFFMPTLYIYEGRLRAVDLFVGIIDDFGRPRPMDDHNRTHFLSHMFAR